MVLFVDLDSETVYIDLRHRLKTLNYTCVRQTCRQDERIVYVQARSQDFFFGGGGVRSLERKGYFCQRFSVAVKSIYNQLRHNNSLLL